MFSIPEETIGMETLRSIESKIVNMFIMSNTIDVIVKLYFSGIVTKEFNIDFIQFNTITWASIGEERGTTPGFLMDFILT